MGPIRDPLVAQFVKLFLPRLVERFHPSRVLLFGSRARGEALAGRSDLDLLVVSEAFAGLRFPERAGEVLWALQTPFPIEVLCYTAEEYESKKHELGIVRIASQEGVDLLAPGPHPA